MRRRSLESRRWVPPARARWLPHSLRASKQLVDRSVRRWDPLARHLTRLWSLWHRIRRPRYEGSGEYRISMLLQRPLVTAIEGEPAGPAWPRRSALGPSGGGEGPQRAQGTAEPRYLKLVSIVRLPGSRVHDSQVAPVPPVSREAVRFGEHPPGGVRTTVPDRASTTGAASRGIRISSAVRRRELRPAPAFIKRGADMEDLVPAAENLVSREDHGAAADQSNAVLAPVEIRSGIDQPGATPSAVERLIEATISPGEVSGLQIRPLSPPQVASLRPLATSGDPRTTTGELGPDSEPASEETGREASSEETGRKGLRPGPPELDLDNVALRVSRLLVRQRLIERERRGRY